MMRTDHRQRLMLVEDDERLAALVREYLEHHDFAVEVHQRATPALQRIVAAPPDVLILDVMLPDMTGFDVCRAARKHYRGPILMLTARDDEVDEILGLELGADDYLIKPVRPGILVSRIRALLRRASEPAATVTSTQETFTFGGLCIQTAARRVTLDGVTIGLGAREFELLVLLARHAGTIVHREDIMTSLRGIEYDGLDRSIDVSISRLRRRLGDTGNPPVRIKAIRSRGYLFVTDAW